MSRIVGSALCAVVLAAAAPPAFAAEAAGAAPPAASARALDCARRYTAAMRMEETMAATMSAIVPKSGDGEADAAMAIVSEAMAEILPKMMDELAPVMAGTYSEAELCALADFYGSPLGQGIVDKTPEFARASAEVSMKWAMKGVELAVERIKAREAMKKGKAAS